MAVERIEGENGTLAVARRPSDDSELRIVREGACARGALIQATEGNEIRLVDNQAGCPTYAGDLADAIIQLLQLPDFPHGILHYCGDHALSAYKFAQAVFKAESERNPAFVMPPLTAISMAELNPQSRRPQYSALNGDKARSLGLTPSDWQKALPQVLAAIAQA